MSFRDAKRPVTKALLQRLDLGAIVAQTDRALLAAPHEATLRNELCTQPAQPLAEMIARVISATEFAEVVAQRTSGLPA